MEKHPGNNAVRISKRANKGKPPKRYGRSLEREVVEPARETSILSAKTTPQARSLPTQVGVPVNLGECERSHIIPNVRVLNPTPGTSVKSSSVREFNRQELEKRRIELELAKIDLERKKMELEAEERRHSLQSRRSESLKSASTEDYGEDRTSRWIEEQNLQEAGKNQDIMCQLAEMFTKVAENIKPQPYANPSKLYLQDLPVFNGLPEDWPIFYEQFQSSTSRLNLSDEDNIIRLRKCLTGKAKEAVNCLLLSSRNVHDIIDQLKLNFGRPDIIIMRLVQKARNVASPKEDNLESIILFSNAVRNLVANMECFNFLGHMNNPELLGELVEKLPFFLKMSWGTHAIKEKNSECNLKDFDLWLKEVTHTACYVSSTSSKNKFSHKGRNMVLNTTEAVPTSDPKTKKVAECKVCKLEGHLVADCEDFVNISVEDRLKVVAELKLCFCCLRFGHPVFRCKAKKKCNVNECKRLHHKLLHAEPIIESEISKVNNVNQKDSKVFLRIAPVVLKGPNSEIKTYALFDEASTVTLLDSTAAKLLGLSGRKQPFCFQWTNEITRHEENSQIVSLLISGSSSKAFKLDNVRTVDNLSLPNQTVDMMSLLKSYPYLSEANCSSMKNAQPMILIGQDNCSLTIPREILERNPEEPFASRTQLGWVIHGQLQKNSNRIDRKYLFHIQCCLDADEILHKMVEDTFKMETFGVATNTENAPSREDLKAIAMLESSIRKLPNRYEVGLPWKDEDAVLPESQDVAFKRLRCLEKKLDRNQNLALQYCTKFEEYIHKGYMTKLNREEASMFNKKTWFIPHFPVVNENKPGQIRIVFDAAAKSNGTSLNEALLKGPDLLTSLVGVLMRFRMKPIAFGGDISEMFHQITIRKEDRASQRFLWRGMNRGGPCEIYEMNAMIFGSISSPFIAHFVKNKNAIENKEEFPAVERAILRQHYVDDYLDCQNSEEDAIKLIKNVIEVHRRGGFKMCKWISNSSKVLESLPAELKTKCSKNMNIDEQNMAERVLGLWWSPEKDIFIFKLNFTKIDSNITNGIKVPTKRELLRVIMSVFDPLGFLAPLIVKVRILMQEIWKQRIGWDDEVNLVLFAKWKTWLSQLEDIRTFQIPRCYSNLLAQQNSNVQLHIFCDSSEKAFAAVAYLRIENNEAVQTILIMSKFKVSPLKQRATIPRLELQAALIGSRMGSTIKQELDTHISKIFYWSDSKTVLSWIRTESNRLKTYVANRVAEIRDLTDVGNWFWVSTKENVADLATRETYYDLTNSRFWIDGPEFLRKSIKEWPNQDFKSNSQELKEESEEIKEVILVLSDEEAILEGPDVNRFSSWLRCIRSTAWMLRYVNCCKRTNICDIELSAEELVKAEYHQIKKAQQECYGPEIKSITSGREIDKKSKLWKLYLKIDDNGILRIEGRIKSSENSMNVKEPILLDSNHGLTKLLIDYHHKKMNHQGRETVINEIRQKFWVTNLRNTVRKVVFNCPYCRNHRVKPSIPTIGDIPKERLRSHLPPFTYTGMDYFGPLEVSVRRRTEKRYGVIFTCFNSRAVHLELAESLTTDSTILCIMRFIARRGMPLEIWSDNGANLRGADIELRKSIKELNQSKLISDMAVRGIKWKFIPPASPNMGGCWERLIRSIKVSLRAVLRNRIPKEETLRTFLTETESILNSRPLTHVSVDIHDQEALTPNHFLIGRSSMNQSIGKFEASEVGLRKQWRAAQAMADQFWNRWVKEYLPILHRKNNLHHRMDNIKVGDVVIVADNKEPRKSWPLGLIEFVHPGKDGIVRVVDVKTKSGVYRRPVSKICKLSVE